MNNQSLEGLLEGKTWRTYRISKLHKFRRDPKALRNYSQDLITHLTAEYNQPNEKISAQILPTKSANDKNDVSNKTSVVIAVLLERNEQTETSFLCVLSSINSSQTEGDEFAEFPLLLIRGLHSNLANYTLSWLQLQFDCCISPLHITPYELSYLSCKWSLSDQNNKQLELVFSTPSSIVGLNNITLSVDYKSVQSLLEQVNNNEEDDDNNNNSNSKKNKKSNKKKKVIDIDHLSQQFMNLLFDYFEHQFHINLKSCSMIRIGTPVAYLNFDGKVKIISNSVKLLEQMSVCVDRTNMK